MSAADFPQPPIFSPCGATTPPSLPEQFHAIALLTPFTNTQLVVADIYYDWSVPGMRVTTYGLESGYADFLYLPDSYFILDSENGGEPKQVFGPIATTEQVPAPNWLTNYKVTCNGIQEVVGVNTNWWCDVTMNTNPPAPIPPDPTAHPAANWFWMRSDNQYPWRMMFINTTNDYKLPFIGRFAIVHFPTFEATNDTGLSELLQTCQSQSQQLDSKTAVKLRVKKAEDTYALLNGQPFLSSNVNREKTLGKIQELIPGLNPPDNNPLPSWPSRLFMTALSTPTFEQPPTPNQPYPTEVYYDWTIQRQLTRFHIPSPSGALMDLILTDSQTYVVLRLPDGSHQCLKNLYVSVGLVRPDWPTHDGAVCKGSITNNPQLSPNKTTQIFTLPSMQSRVFWIWYTTDNVAIMFAEVPQACNVKLVLTDYFAYIPSPPAFDPSLFQIPADCLVLPAASVTNLKPGLAKRSKRKKKAAPKVVKKKTTKGKSTKKKATAMAARKTVTRRTTKKTSKTKQGRKPVTRTSAKKTSKAKAVKKTSARKPAKKATSAKTSRRRANRKK